MNEAIKRFVRKECIITAMDENVGGVINERYLKKLSHSFIYTIFLLVELFKKGWFYKATFEKKFSKHSKHTISKSDSLRLLPDLYCC
jgi:hypothetical protein